MTSRNLKICRAVARVFGLQLNEMLSRSRVQPIAFARQIAMALSLESCGVWNEVGACKYTADQFKLWDWETIRYAGERIYHERKTGYPKDQALILRCEQAVKEALA